MALPFSPLHLVDINPKKDIWNHMYIAAVKQKFSKIDQENLELKVKKNGNNNHQMIISFSEDMALYIKDVQKNQQYRIKKKNQKDAVEFLVTEKRVIKCKPYTSTVELYCVCPMPYWRTDEIGLRMAECKSCKRWFHHKCAKISAAVFSAGKQWSCLNCKQSKSVF